MNEGSTGKVTVQNGPLCTMERSPDCAPGIY